MRDYDGLTRPAATVVIVRDRPGAAAELLMMERASTMSFAAGALVFPGGAVDEADKMLSARYDTGLPLDEAAARIAAIRETIEEAGLAIAITGEMNQAMILRLRDGLHDGAMLGDLLERHNLTLDIQALTPFARWHPAPFDHATRVFDTRFYLARAPEGQVATVDSSENVRLFWSSATDTLAQCDGGNGRVISPTRRNLERLARHHRHADLVADAASFPIEKIQPWREDRDGVPHLCIPDHLGYPVTAEPMAAVQRA